MTKYFQTRKKVSDGQWLYGKPPNFQRGKTFPIDSNCAESPQIFHHQTRKDISVWQKAPKFATTKQGKMFPYDTNWTETPLNFLLPRFPCTFRLLKNKRSMLFLFQQSMPCGFFKAFFTEFRVVKANLCTKGNYKEKCGGISARLLFSVLFF